MTSGLSALAVAAFAPPPEGAIPPGLEALVRHACAGAWRAIEVVLAGDVLRGRLSKTRDSIIREAVEGVLALFGNAASGGNIGIRADALASLRAARDAGALDDALDIAEIVDAVRTHGAVAVGRTAVADVRRALAAYRDLETALADHELASLLVDAARACFRAVARDPALTVWAIGPTGSPARDRALAAFAELAESPGSLAELETLISMPIVLDENVQFTVYRPRTIDPGKWHQLLAFAHLAERRLGEDDLPDPVEEVQRQAASVLGAKAKQYQPVVQDSGSAIPEEGELTFVPEFPGIEVNPPRRSFLWLESVHREEFRIRAGAQLDGKTVRGRLTVFLGHIAIAEVALSVRVDAKAGAPEKVREPQHARAYRKIFASYSHRDIAIVNQFETYARALGDEYLRDWVHLRTGEVWTDRLCQLIEQADAFQLFWSRNSMHSQFVRQEYEHALSLGRPSFVRPTYWEEPMPTGPGLPPESLLRLHFQKLGAEMITTGAGSRAEPREERKAKKREVDGGSLDREYERAPTARASETMRSIPREVADAMAGAEEALDSWGDSTDHNTDRSAAAPEHDADDDDLDPASSFAETRHAIAPAPPREQAVVPKRLTTEPGAAPGPSGADALEKRKTSIEPPASRSRVARPGGTMPPAAPPAAPSRAASAARPGPSSVSRPAPSPSRSESSSPPPASRSEPPAPMATLPPPSLPALPKGPASSRPPIAIPPIAPRPSSPRSVPASPVRPSAPGFPPPIVAPATPIRPVPAMPSPRAAPRASSPSKPLQSDAAWPDDEATPIEAQSPDFDTGARSVPSPSPSPDSWTDEDHKEAPPSPGRPRAPASMPARPMAQPRPSQPLFPPDPDARPDVAPAPSPYPVSTQAPAEPFTITQPMTMSQPGPITTTLPGVRVDDAMRAPSSPAIVPPAPGPMGALPPTAFPEDVPPGPASATMLAPVRSKTMMSAPVVTRPDVSPYAPTGVQEAYPAAADELTPEVVKQDAVNPNAQLIKLPEAPAAHGWVLAVLVVLIVVAAVVVIVVLL